MKTTDLKIAAEAACAIAVQAIRSLRVMAVSHSGKLAATALIEKARAAMKTWCSALKVEAVEAGDAAAAGGFAPELVQVAKNLLAEFERADAIDTLWHAAANPTSENQDVAYVAEHPSSASAFGVAPEDEQPLDQEAEVHPRDGSRGFDHAAGYAD